MLMYLSVASEAMSEDQLNDILNESRAWNKSHDLTGCLAYVEGNLKGKSQCRFIQVLEGPKEQVKGIFENIQNDPRHMHINVIKEGAIGSRNFGTWEMGFERINLDTNADLQEFFELDTKVLSENGDLSNNILLNFMKAFYSNH